MAPILVMIFAFLPTAGLAPVQDDTVPEKSTPMIPVQEKTNNEAPEIVARVGDAIITRRQLILDLQGRGRREAQSVEQVLSQLIERLVLREKGKELGITISDEIIEADFKSQAKRAKLTPEEFERGLKDFGLTVKNWKEEIHDQYVFRALMRDRPDIRHRIQVTPDEIRSYWHNVHPKKRVDSPQVTIEAALVELSKAKGARDCEEQAQRLRETAVNTGDLVGATELMECARMTEQLPPVILDPKQDRSQLLPAIVQFAETEPEEGTVSEIVPAAGGSFLVLRASKFTAGQVHEYTFKEVQRQIDITLSNQKWEALKRHYVREIAPEFDIFPPNLIQPAASSSRS